MESAEDMFTEMFAGNGEATEPMDDDVDLDADVDDEEPTSQEEEASSPFCYHGQDENQPVGTANAFRLFYPDGAEVDNGADRSFRELAAKIGITPRQAQAISDWAFKMAR